MGVNVRTAFTGNSTQTHPGVDVVLDGNPTFIGNANRPQDEETLFYSTPAGEIDDGNHMDFGALRARSGPFGQPIVDQSHLPAWMRGYHGS